MKKSLFVVITLITNLTFAQTYNNGGLSTGTISKSGITAPAGYTWSEVQNNTGNTTESNTSAGVSGSYVSDVNNYYLADDFTIPPGANWQISSIDFFGYETGYSGATSPFNVVRVSILGSDPSDPGTITHFGDDVTNRFSSSESAHMYRIFNSSVPAPGTPTGTTREIWKVTANVGTTLSPGTYWVKYQLQNQTSTQNYLPSVTIPGSRGLASFNAKQLNATTGIWSDLVDFGNPAEAPDYTIDMPFIINFTQTMGTGEIMSMDNRIKLYPNPAQDHFSTFLPDNFNKNNLKISVKDLTGKVVMNFNQFQDEFNISQLPKGMYVVTVTDGKNFNTNKLIKK